MEGQPHPQDPQGPQSQGDPAGQPSEEELRARIEEQLRRVRVQDLIVDSVASIVNLTARRIAKEDERDLEQARVGIEAVRAVEGLLPAEAQAQVKSALSELQMLYAQASEGGPVGQGARQEGTSEAGEPGESEQPPAERPQPPPQRPQQSRPAGGAQPPPRLWTPHQRD